MRACQSALATLLGNPPLTHVQSATDAADVLLEAQPRCSAPSEGMACAIIMGALERGNTPLALSLYDSMCQARSRMAVAAAAADAAAAAGGIPPQQLVSGSSFGSSVDEEDEGAPFTW